MTNTSAQNSPPKVVLVDAGWRQTLFLAEALQARGVSVTLLTTTAGAAPRYLASWLTCVRIDHIGSEAFVKTLQAFDQDPEVTHIYPVAEEAIFACAHHLPTSMKLYPRLDDQQLTLIASKPKMVAFAAEVGLPTPGFEAVRSIDDLESLAERFGFPVVLKGNGGTSGSRVAICNDAQALRSEFERLRDFDPVVEQFIQGDTWLAGGFFVEGKPVRAQFCRKIRTNPPRTGHSIEIIHDDPQNLRTNFEKIFAALKWNGYASADFILTPDGQFFFLEVNPRPWGAITAAEAAGLDIFSPIAEVFLGLPPKVDLENRSGWRGYVFPSYAMAEAAKKSILGLIGMCFDLRFWKGFLFAYPRANTYCFRDIFWNFFR